MKLKLFSKQTAKKLINVQKNLPFPTGECPRCKASYFIDETPMYCRKCHQRLLREV